MSETPEGAAKTAGWYPLFGITRCDMQDLEMLNKMKDLFLMGQIYSLRSSEMLIHTYLQQRIMSMVRMMYG